MASQAETVDLLVRKAKFEPQVALAVAEAIDNAMTNSQLVTVPVLDARLADLRAEIRSDMQASVSRVEKELVVMREGFAKELGVTKEGFGKELGVVRES